MRLAEEKNQLNILQEEATLWLPGVELAADKSATALVQSNENQWIGKLFACETPIYSCKIYYLWTFLPLYGGRFQTSSTGEKNMALCC
jgi:hypothetical protein